MTVGREEYKEDDIQGVMVPKWHHNAPAYILNLNKKNERGVVYDTPEYNKLRDKENIEENLIQLSGASSDPPSSLIRFSGSETAKVDPCGGGDCADPGSMSALLLSPVNNMYLHHQCTLR